MVPVLSGVVAADCLCMSSPTSDKTYISVASLHSCNSSENPAALHGLCVIKSAMCCSLRLTAAMMKHLPCVYAYCLPIWSLKMRVLRKNIFKVSDIPMNGRGYIIQL